VHRHVGQAAVVIGGGMSQPEAMSRAPGPEQAVYISANEHGVKYYPCRYIVCLDMIEARLRPFGVPIVSPRRYGEFRVFRNPWSQSGMLGAYIAWIMGCSPIYLAGMDCFVGGTYHDDPEAKSSGKSISLDNHLRRWAALRDHTRADIRALAGTLVEKGIFPPPNPAAAAAPAATAQTLYREIGGIVVEFKTAWKDCRPLRYAAGGVHEISLNEAQRARARRATRQIGIVSTAPHLILETAPAKRAGAVGSPS